MSDLDLFVCERLDGARLTRRGCALKYRAAIEHRHASAGSAGYHQTHHCRGCAIGAAHDVGERPDVPLAQLSAPTVGAQLVRGFEQMPGAAAAMDEALDDLEREEDEMGKAARMIAIDGKELSAEGWSKELGVGLSSLYESAKRRSTSVAAEIERRVRERDGRAAAAPPARALEQEVSDVIKSVGLVELAERLGYDVEDLGAHPRGRLILVVEG